MPRLQLVIVALPVHQHRETDKRGYDDVHAIKQFGTKLRFAYEPINMRRMQAERSGLAAVLADETCSMPCAISPPTSQAKFFMGITSCDFFFGDCLVQRRGFILRGLTVAR